MILSQMVTKKEAQVIVASKDTLQQRHSPDATVHASHIDREENTSIVPEKPSQDGYNWRKYGQKNVKGNEYIRNYYRCSYRNCLVKKRVECSPDGRITDITYQGKHDHPKPHSETQEAVPFSPSVEVKALDSSLSVVKDKPSDARTSTMEKVQPQPMVTCGRLKLVKHDNLVDSSHSAANQAGDIHHESMTPKKRKKAVDGAEIITEKPTNESRHVVHTVSEVDNVNDGYRWRKYGQKMVKGNPNPRGYYRCSTARCPMKKHVERASHDPKVVITTYEGEHDHAILPIGALVPQSTSISKSLENDAAQNGSSEKDDDIGLSAKEFTTKEVVETEPKILPGEQKMQAEAKGSEENEQIKHVITSEKQMEDSPISTSSNPVEQEKVTPIQETKIEVVSTKHSDHGDSKKVSNKKRRTRLRK